MFPHVNCPSDLLTGGYPYPIMLCNDYPEFHATDRGEYLARSSSWGGTKPWGATFNLSSFFSYLGCTLPGRLPCPGGTLPRGVPCWGDTLPGAYPDYVYNMHQGGVPTLVHYELNKSQYAKCVHAVKGLSYFWCENSWCALCKGMYHQLQPLDSIDIILIPQSDRLNLNFKCFINVTFSTLHSVH